MGERGAQLLQTARGQISELVGLLSTHGDAALTRPCPGRGTLGDGTVGATAMHAADNYGRIAGFLQATVGGPGSYRESGHGGHYRAEDVDLDDLLERLARALNAVNLVGELSDEHLHEVPPRSDMRFCDGQRTLEQVLTSLLRHQRHQVDALRAAVESARCHSASGLSPESG